MHTKFFWGHMLGFLPKGAHRVSIPPIFCCVCLPYFLPCIHYANAATTRYSSCLPISSLDHGIRAVLLAFSRSSAAVKDHFLLLGMRTGVVVPLHLLVSDLAHRTYVSCPLPH